MNRLGNRSPTASRNKAALVGMLGIHNPTGFKIFLLVTFMVFLGWFGDTTLWIAQALVSGKAMPSALSMLAGIGPFITLLLLAMMRWRKAQAETMTQRAQAETVQPHEAVILFLSHIQDNFTEKVQAHDMSVFQEDRFPWAQCERGLDVHKEHLKIVWVICSPESSKQFGMFKHLFETLYPNVKFEQIGPVDFNLVEKVSDSIEDIYDNLPYDIDEVEVMIDITSGTKTASIAGVLASTASPSREIQYVSEIKNRNGSHSYPVKTYKYDLNFFGKGYKQKNDNN